MLSKYNVLCPACGKNIPGHIGLFGDVHYDCRCGTKIDEERMENAPHYEWWENLPQFLSTKTKG